MPIQTPNRDVFPSQETSALFVSIEPLIINPVIDEAFNRYEARAVQAKRTYHQFGRLSVLLITASSIYAFADALIIPDFPHQIWLSVFLGLLAALGIMLQLYLLASKKKTTWLLSRFATERLRSAKFQAYALAEGARDTQDLQREVEAFSKRIVAEIENELNAGISVLDTFRPGDAMVAPSTPVQPGNPQILETARTAYTELRIKYQQRFAMSEVDRLRRGQRYYASLSDMLYLSGASLVLTSLLLRVFYADAAIWGHWIDFLASATFISAVAIAILDHGRLAKRSSARFLDYHAAIEDLASPEASGRGLNLWVGEMELIVLDELRSFSEASQTISYRM
ncbi:MAG: hypothetical protein NXH72_05295 [Hyphomonadaceae bacterium]|nr:hypothetical protein [Hyphomonadaceae bacterium]